MLKTSLESSEILVSLKFFLTLKQFTVSPIET